MSQEKLREASEILREASESIDGAPAERLREQADALGDQADAGRGPDHGQVARHQAKLRSIKADADAVADEIDRAYALCNEYRETVEGV
ncbi:MAG: hypothetical protein ABEH88_12605 [Halobacteriales archaeon]